MHVNGNSTPSASSLGKPSARLTSPTMANPFDIYSEVEARKPVSIDGHTLSIADIISVACHGVDVSLSKDSAVHKRIDDSVAFLESKKHLSIYGVSTGFGGSADTRTGDLSALQVSLLEHQLCGYLPLDASYEFLSNNHSMPIPIVRGAIAIRVNSLARGHSGVRKVVLQALLNLLNNGLVPCVPLRGSISASGDLSPLSYVAGAICGHPDVRVFDTKNKEVLYATEAIEKYKLNKITLAAKEGLGLVNGTAFSASAGCLAFYDALNLASTSLAATAMTVEAMVGQVGSFDQFIHDVTRPHAGQIAAAAFVRSLLAGSKLAVSEEGEVAIQDDVGILRQDRYALRTSAQWIGPQLESLALARSQIEAELNSTTDNPLLDVEGDKIHHGGNFQAMAITQAMESTRRVLEHLGKLSFSQVTELINCSMNRGLPSCLAGDEPSTNYHTKGLDIHSAAYCSELGYLANPVSTHVQSTEMHNQSVNSLALISARKTIESNDVLSLLLGTHLYCAAQAIDLRIADVKFQAQVRQLLNEQIKKHFGSALQGKDLEKLQHKVFVALLKRLEETASSDSGPRFEDASRHIMGHLMETVVPLIANNPGVAASLGSFQKEFLEGSLSLYRSIRKATTTGNDNLADAKENMGSAIAIYQCIRGELGVSVRRGDVAEGKHGRSVGGNVSRIVTALRDGRLVKAVGEAAGFVKIGEQNGAARGGISDPSSMHGHGGSFY